MAERKRTLVIDVWNAGYGFTVWFDGTMRDLLGIEGVAGAAMIPYEGRSTSRWSVHVDPRYDVGEVAMAVLAKFDTPIPDAFKDAMEDTP